MVCKIDMGRLINFVGFDALFNLSNNFFSGRQSPSCSALEKLCYMNTFNNILLVLLDQQWTTLLTLNVLTIMLSANTVMWKAKW